MADLRFHSLNERSFALQRFERLGGTGFETGQSYLATALPSEPNEATAAAAASIDNATIEQPLLIVGCRNCCCKARPVRIAAYLCPYLLTIEAIITDIASRAPTWWHWLWQHSVEDAPLIADLQTFFKRRLTVATALQHAITRQLDSED